jgi:hypothetical protein
VILQPSFEDRLNVERDFTKIKTANCDQISVRRERLVCGPDTQ